MRRRLKNRKGVFVVLFGLLFMVLMAAGAMAIDMSRIWSMRNELQTSADAAALAGAVQLSAPHNRNFTDDTARLVAQRNTALYDVVNVDEVQPGQWDDDAQTFTNSSLPQATAVRVTVSHPTNKLIIGALGIAAPVVKATAIAWGNAPVDNTSCVRPWSIPYVVLMDKVNRKRIATGNWPYADTDPDSPANLTRDFTDEDRTVLNTMTEAERTFNLKMGAGNGNQTTVEDPPPGATMPGSYQAVKLPRKRSADGTVNPDGIAPQSGADAYRDAVSGAVCYTLGIGDVLEVQTGDMTGPTLQGAERNGSEQFYVCYTITSAGACLDQNGNVGVDVKSAFHLCYSGCTGASEVTVRMLGSFTLTKVMPIGGGAPDPNNPPASIGGYFKPIMANGPVGPGPTTIRKIILVR